MRCYGNVKGFTYRTAQPEPVLTCPRCGRKAPERDYMEGGRRTGLCARCRKAAREAAEREASAGTAGKEER